MNNTVVLGGDYTVTLAADGDLDLVLASSASHSLTVPLDGTADLLNVLDGDLDLTIPQDGEFGIVTTVHGGAYPAYTGETVITPTTETQTLNTASKSVLSNITINPIPSNYGLITWNGSTLTVS